VGRLSVAFRRAPSTPPRPSLPLTLGESRSRRDNPLGDVLARHQGRVHERVQRLGRVVGVMVQRNPQPALTARLNSNASAPRTSPTTMRSGRIPSTNLLFPYPFGLRGGLLAAGVVPVDARGRCGASMFPGRPVPNLARPRRFAGSGLEHGGEIRHRVGSRRRRH
jgi:hypothetical protein